MKKFVLLTMAGVMAVCAQAQRVTDRLDRGLVAVPAISGGGNLVTWRMFGEEYYDTQYNLYRDGVKIAGPLKKTNYQDTSGSSSATYQVESVVRGVPQEMSPSVKAWPQQYMEVKVQPVVNRAGQTMPDAVTNGAQNTVAGYTLNDVSLADVDGDGVCEFLVKRKNEQGNISLTSNTTDFNLYECYKTDGTRLWWIDLGPNMMAGPDEQWDMIGFDWDEDGRAEVLMRGADNMIIHTASGMTINIGDMSYDNGAGGTSRPEYTHTGAEYLLYLDGQTGMPYGFVPTEGASVQTFTPMPYPLPRYEQGESDYASVWGQADTGHRSSKHYFGAPYLDGRHASIFLGRGCYTRHKMCALDVDPDTHELTQRWRWNCYDSRSPWFGNGFHNFAIADVDMDGRDEIVFGSMVIDDTGYGLATTGLGHGDAQHCGDLDPYRWGLEQFTCQEGSEGNSYWNATTGNMYYRKSDGGDDGRALAGNFTNDVPGGQGRTVSSGIIGLSSDKVIYSNGDSYMAWGDLNNRIYWDGDLLDEILNSPGVQRSAKITKWGNGRLLFTNSSGQYTPVGILNNSTKNNPSAQGDILGDWREELVLRSPDNKSLFIITTNYPTDYGIYTLWHDHEYRNGMAWQSVGYNQPPHVSYFLGELEGITVAPPPLMLRGRTEVPGVSTIVTTDDHLLISGYQDLTFSVADGAAPYMLTVNTPAWVQGSGDRQATSSTPKSPERTIINYKHTLTGGAFSGSMRLVKQGEGTLVLPNVSQTYTGPTDVWNGTLQFDGTMECSRVWLNRHTALESHGGHFMGGLQADYNAAIYPGGRDHVGNISVSQLDLRFGSRVVFDIDGCQTDQLHAEKLIVEVKNWDNGPKYKTPVFEFREARDLDEGIYVLGRIDTLVGSPSSILIEGLGNQRYYLDYADGQLRLVVENFRDNTTVVWNGSVDNNTWDLGESRNFLNDGQPDYAASGDDIIFDDQAQLTTVVVKGAVRPHSITFSNETKNYIINGDSILGGGTITKNGAATTTINTENRTGDTYLNGGRLVVGTLANANGQTYGALGGVSSTIRLNGGTLSANGVIITDQPFVATGTNTIDVGNGMSLTLGSGIVGSGAGAEIVKTGVGALSLGVGNSFDRLVIRQGNVNAAENNSSIVQLPDTVEFQGGTLYDPATENSYSLNTTNFVVPEGHTGTFYGDPRCNYTGTLTGKGTFNVYGTWVRCYYQGDWSQFEGTIVPGLHDRSTKHGYAPSFDFQNAKGLPKATLKLNADVTFNSNQNIEVGNVTGTGTLGGTGTYTLGSNGGDITATFSSTAPIVKRGDGYLRVTAAGRFSAPVTVHAGELQINDATMASPFFGSNALRVLGTGSVVGQGLLASLTLESGAMLTPRMWYSETSPATIKTNAAANIQAGATLHIIIKSADSYSKFEPQFLTMNGTLRVTLADGYVPKAGDAFTLWTVGRTFAGQPSYDLPALPEGLYWDTRELASRLGVLRITDDGSIGIDGLAGSNYVFYEVYTPGGTRVAAFRVTRSEAPQRLVSLPLSAGTYIIKMRFRNHTETEKMIVR